MEFLPVNKKDMEKRGWIQPDFVLVTGDGYVDHSSFGTAIISRYLELFGYKVAILAQPNWHSAEDFKRFGKPKLGFLINSGNVDSMVNHYSVFKRRRKIDQYSPGGKSGHRPDRSVIVYSQRAREAYKDVPIIIGGIEASLRRFGHYDYWDDKIRRSILLDSKADLLIYGMGERAVVEIAQALESGIEVKDLSWIMGTCFKSKELPYGTDYIKLPTFQEIQENKRAYGKSFLSQYKNSDSITGKILVEEYDNSQYIISNPPQRVLEEEELDHMYELPYMGTYHPMYEKEGGIPAIREVKFSIVSNRGCYGGCSFCALTYHQGRQVRSRSKTSIVNEARQLTTLPDFKGYIHDIGGPTANFQGPSCEKQRTKGVCMNKDCLFPKPCKHLEVDHSRYLDILRETRSLPGVKKVFIRSGIRYDYLLEDKDRQFFQELCEHHISGTLKVAPEHISQRVLEQMRKPKQEVFDKFVGQYKEMNKKLGKNQYLIPYLISSHPGSTLEDAIELALYLKKTGFVPDQVQDYYPTPGTLSTCMYYTGYNPFTGEKVYVAKKLKEKKQQRALMHFHKKENREMVKEALRAAHRSELIPVLLGGEKG